MILRISIGAFVLSETSADALEAVRGDRILMRATMTVEDGGIDAALAYLAENPTPDLLILETAAEGDALFEQLNQLSSVCAPDTRVILLGVQNDISLFKELVHQGISEYMVRPVTSDQLRDSISRIFSDQSSRKAARVISFFGTRGGTGSSMLAANVAESLGRQFNADVITIDLDIPFGTAALTFNIQPRQTVADALMQTNRLDAVIVERFLQDVDHKCQLLSSPASISANVNVTTDGFNTVMGFARQMADFVVLDVPHTWGSWVQDVLMDADETILVAEPDLANLRDCKNLVELLGPKRGVDAPLRLVLNKVGVPKKPELGAKDFKETCAKEPSAQIPFEPTLFGTAMNNGVLISKAGKGSKVAEVIDEIAVLVSSRELKGDAAGAKKGAGLLGFLKLGKKKAEPAEAEA